MKYLHKPLLNLMSREGIEPVRLQSRHSHFESYINQLVTEVARCQCVPKRFKMAYYATQYPDKIL